MSSVIFISDDEQEEFAIAPHQNLSSPIPPERFLANRSLTDKRMKVKSRVKPPAQRKRKRDSDSGVDPVDLVEAKGGSKAKKTRKEEHKAVSVSFAALWRRHVLIESSLVFSVLI
jgi:hypothetical protein